MDKDKYRGIGRRTDVLKRLNAETLMEIKRGLIGELPEKLRPPPPIPVRGGHTELVISKPSGFLSSCLPVIPDSPTSGRNTPSDDENNVPLRKTFSFREKFSRLSRLGKDKTKKDEKKWNTIVEDDKDHEIKEIKEKHYDKKHNRDYEHKSSKRFWWSRHKEIAERPNSHKPVYKRSKSFEFLPRALEEDNKEVVYRKMTKNSNSYVFGSTDTMGDAWTSNDSLEYFTNSVYYDDADDTVFIKDIKESKSSNNNSSLSTSASSGLVANIFKTDSVQNLLEEFDRTVELFSENYLSDCETYCKTETPLTKREKRKSSSFSTLQSPKVVQVSKLNEISNDFKKELELLIARRGSDPKTPRRGSVTDWFVLEDRNTSSNDNKYSRAQKKSTKRVRRMSSTKYWITPEECAEYSREQRPPLVIPRITTYRAPRPRAQNSVISSEDSYLDSSPPSQHYERLQDSWGPICDRGRGKDIRNLTKPNSNLILSGRLDKRLGNSTENLSNSRRPHLLQIPPSSSGDSLDVEVRDRTLEYGRIRNCRSMVAPKSTRKSPLPTPRQILPVEATVVLEGPMKRTKYTENSKKSKKNWTDCYVVLTTTALYFYKDQKTYNATKVPPGTPPSPNAARLEVVLPLLNAHIVQCIQQHTRRYTRSLIFTVDHQQYLIQDETEQGAKKWLKAIGETIYKLGPPGIGEFHNSHTPQYQSSNTDLESLGRTPPVSRHANRNKAKAGGSSNEDLSEFPEKTQVKSKLKKFLHKRPSKDILYKKGILRDEPVFGRNLDTVCPIAHPRVPPFVVACIKEIESSEENMCTDGLYRASGNLSQVQKIRLQVDQNNLNVIAENTDIHVLTGSLKLFFRELKEPLIPYNLFDRVLKACMIKPREARIKEFREIVQALPQCNRDTLKYLLEHLLRVTDHSEHNRMHTANLAIVFGPTLLWAPAEKVCDIAMDCIQQNNVVDVLLNDFKEIFDNKKKS